MIENLMPIYKDVFNSKIYFPNEKKNILRKREIFIETKKNVLIYVISKKEKPC